MADTTSSSLSVGLVGAAGRMGRALQACIDADDHLRLACALDHDATATALDEACRTADVLIDFSSPTGCLDAARAAADHGTPLVTGTTGLSPEQSLELEALSAKAPLLQAANFSVGVTILARLVRLAAQASGPDFDLEIVEAHHRHKVDAPSGTALMLARQAAAGRDLEGPLDDHATFARHGHTGPRPSGPIGMQTVRGGDIVGEHTVMLCGQGERLELVHRATDRKIFALGALRAARWLVDQSPERIYRMDEVLFGQDA